jgi:hypothetical protein
MISNHIGLLSATPAALGPASDKPFTPTVGPPCSRHLPYWPLFEQPLTSYQGLLLLITGNTHGVKVNFGQPLPLPQLRPFSQDRMIGA